jgi:predicted AAA+ superfamily ATPase
MDSRDIAELEAGMRRRSSSVPGRIRPFTRERGSLPRAFVLSGPRGVGKTTFLLHHIHDSGMLYLSADNPTFAGDSLYDIAKAIFLAGYPGVAIDEVHFARDWSIHLKALYDDFPRHLLWVSDSSSLVLRSGVGDLSRRYVPINMPLLSFREFLFLETGKDYPVRDPFGGEAPLPIDPTPKILSAFRGYRSRGTRPFYAEGDFEERLLAILDKTLYSDIPFFLPNVTDGNLRLMKAIVGTLARSTIPRLQVRSLCADWGIGADKLYQILNVMESVGLLRIIRLERETKAKSVGAKLFFSDPAFYSALRGKPGSAREAMVASLCTDTGWTVEAARDETSCDFVISRPEGGGMRELRLEVGGSSKKAKKADFVIRDDLDFPGGKAIPLWLLGMGY